MLLTNVVLFFSSFSCSVTLCQRARDPSPNVADCYASNRMPHQFGAQAAVYLEPDVHGSSPLPPALRVAPRKRRAQVAFEDIVSSATSPSASPSLMQFDDAPLTSKSARPAKMAAKLALQAQAAVSPRASPDLSVSDVSEKHRVCELGDDGGISDGEFFPSASQLSHQSAAQAAMRRKTGVSGAAANVAVIDQASVCSAVERVSLCLKLPPAHAKLSWLREFLLESGHADFPLPHAIASSPSSVDATSPSSFSLRASSAVPDVYRAPTYTALVAEAASFVLDDIQQLNALCTSLPMDYLYVPEWSGRLGFNERVISAASVKWMELLHRQLAAIANGGCLDTGVEPEHFPAMSFSVALSVASHIDLIPQAFNRLDHVTQEIRGLVNSIQNERFPHIPIALAMSFLDHDEFAQLPTQPAEFDTGDSIHANESSFPSQLELISDLNDLGIVAPPCFSLTLLLRLLNPCASHDSLPRVQSVLAKLLSPALFHVAASASVHHMAFVHSVVKSLCRPKVSSSSFMARSDKFLYGDSSLCHLDAWPRLAFGRGVWIVLYHLLNLTWDMAQRSISIIFGNFPQLSQTSVQLKHTDYLRRYLFVSSLIFRVLRDCHVGSVADNSTSAVEKRSGLHSMFASTLFGPSSPTILTPTVHHECRPRLAALENQVQDISSAMIAEGDILTLVQQLQSEVALAKVQLEIARNAAEEGLQGNSAAVEDSSLKYQYQVAQALHRRAAHLHMVATSATLASRKTSSPVSVWIDEFCSGTPYSLLQLFPSSQNILPGLCC